jgi:uncharacterized protein involved in exopolysaccharide biosynthesis
MKQPIQEGTMITEQTSHNSRSETEWTAVISPESKDRTMNLLFIDVFTQFANHKWLIAKVTLVAMIIGLLYSLSLPNRYSAVTKIMPPQQTPSTTSLLNSIPGVGSIGGIAAGGLSLRDPNAIYLGLLGSRPIADAIINRFKLVDAYHAKDMTAARKELATNTRLDSERSGLISISVTDKDKGRVAELANAYTDELRQLTKTISVTEASRRRLFFEVQLKTAKEDLVSTEVNFQKIQQDQGLLHLDAQSGVLIGRLANISSEITARQVELETLKSYSTENNPDVQLLEHELSALQAEANRLEQHNGPSTFSNLGLKDVPKAGEDYIRAQREVLYHQAFFDLLLKQYEAARLDEAKEGAVIQVVEPAIEPDRKSAPSRAVILLIFTIAGMFLGCLSAYYSRPFKHFLRDPESAAAIQGLRDALNGRKRAAT